MGKIWCQVSITKISSLIEAFNFSAAWVSFLPVISSLGSMIEISDIDSPILSIFKACDMGTKTNCFSTASDSALKTPTILKAFEAISFWVSWDMRISLFPIFVLNFLRNALPTMILFLSSGKRNRPDIMALPIKEIFASFSGSIPTRVTAVACLALEAIAFTLTRFAQRLPGSRIVKRALSSLSISFMEFSTTGSLR